MRTGRLGTLLAPAAALALSGAMLAQETTGRAPAALAVRIVEPAPGAFVSGRTPIRVEVEIPWGMVVERVEFVVNGRLIASLRGPPWRVVHDFGQEYEAWFIQVHAVTRDGRTAQTSVNTRPITIHETARIDLVNVFATVRDGRGRYVMDLEKGDFFLTEDGRPQEIGYFSRDRLPLSVVIVLDSSLSMEGRKIQEAKEAASGFLKALEDGDEVGIIAFSDNVRELQPVSPDREAADAAIQRTGAFGGTALYDAVAEAAQRLSTVEDDRRRAIILLSDGRDEAADGLTPGSILTFEESLAEAVQSNVILYAIGLGRNLDREMDFYQRRSLQEVLATLAGDTGGRAYFTPKAERLNRAYGEIETELRHHYALAYTSSNRRRDGAWRSIELRVREPGYTVLARKGYYAPYEGPLP
jgi:Ca-activated chloride channel family protein